MKILTKLEKWLKRKKHAKEMRLWRKNNNIKKSDLEKYNNKLFMREYNQRPEIKEQHKLQMRLWRIKNENE